ncbi:MULTISPECIES: LicD family protein [unclassified Fibrobacter]|uniref:LicD family protein n=1 Tax=unclassified Fibrobacter TaxID=2634177 RepID=UPI000D6B6274|nr:MULTISPECIES: LicD family protein [unclassified Fibrobacter]PWJ64029.1 lipopolysaccharide cholinephosphotransferase [Fibrobacter sp. UWR4]PZW69234.1 lipopolysaccharide cholinephosphotransferase [Fibrobacter sp. UWR1]
MGIAHKLYQAIGGKEGSFLQKKWSAYCIKKDLKAKQKRLHENGLEALKIFRDTCKECGANYWLEYGTLLGAVRHKSFIPHDFDLDAGMMATDYTEELHKKLIDRGFVFSHAFDYMNLKTGERKKSEYTFTYKGIAFDIFLAFREGDICKVFCYEIGKGCVVKFSMSYTLDCSKPLSTVTIDGEEFSAPSDPAKALTMYYGEDFMTPNSGWTNDYGGSKYAEYYSPEEITGIRILPETNE